MLLQCTCTQLDADLLAQHSEESKLPLLPMWPSIQVLLLVQVTICAEVNKRVTIPMYQLGEEGYCAELTNARLDEVTYVLLHSIVSGATHMF
jgi:hypothetical protein